MSQFLLLLAESEPASLGAIGALIAVALVVFKILEQVISYLIEELKKRKNGGESPQEKASRDIAAVMADVATVCKDLHEWHAVDAPGQPGVKVWWVTEEFKQQIRGLAQKLDKLLEGLSGLGSTQAACRESQLDVIEKQREEIVELREKVEELHQQRVTDRDSLWQRNNDTTREVTVVTKDLIQAITANSELMRLVREALEVE